MEKYIFQKILLASTRYSIGGESQTPPKYGDLQNMENLQNMEEYIFPSFY